MGTSYTSAMESPFLLEVHILYIGRGVPFPLGANSADF